MWFWPKWKNWKVFGQNDFDKKISFIFYLFLQIADYNLAQKYTIQQKIWNAKIVNLK